MPPLLNNDALTTAEFMSAWKTSTDAKSFRFSRMCSKSCIQQRAPDSSSNHFQIQIGRSKTNPVPLEILQSRMQKGVAKRWNPLARVSRPELRNSSGRHGTHFAAFSTAASNQYLLVSSLPMLKGIFPSVLSGTHNRIGRCSISSVQRTGSN